MLNPQKLFREFKTNIYRELDYKREVENAAYLYECYRSPPTISVPYTYAELSTTNIIIQDYVEGFPLTSLLRAKTENSTLFEELIQKYEIDEYMLLRNIGYEFTVQASRYDKFFGDPHPGNIILLGGVKFAFIDFGILDELDIGRNTIYRIMRAVTGISTGFDYTNLTQEILLLGAGDLYRALGVLNSNLSLLSSDNRGFVDTITESYADLLNNKTFGYIALKDKNFGLIDILYDILKLGNKFNVKVPAPMFNTMRSSAIFSSYSACLLPDTDVTPEIYAQMLQEAEVSDFSDAVPVDPIELEAAIEFIIDWITGVAEKDVRLFSNISKMLKEVTYV